MTGSYCTAVLSRGNHPHFASIAWMVAVAHGSARREYPHLNQKTAFVLWTMSKIFIIASIAPVSEKQNHKWCLENERTHSLSRRWACKSYFWIIQPNYGLLLIKINHKEQPKQQKIHDFPVSSVLHGCGSLHTDVIKVSNTTLSRSE